MTISPPKILLNTSMKQYEYLLDAAQSSGISVEAYTLRLIDKALQKPVKPVVIQDEPAQNLVELRSVSDGGATAQ